MANKEVQLSDIVERLVVLETKDGEKDATLKEVLTTVHDIQKQLERYRGVIGGVMLVFACIGTFLKLFWQDIARLIRGG